MSEFLSVAQARAKGGVRLVLTADAPGPWGEAAKGMLHVKKIPFVRVRQTAGSDDPELLEWTGVRNAPQIVDENDNAIDAWADLIQFAEQRASTPRLIPAEAVNRIAMFGTINEIAGKGGFAWNRRLTLFKPIMDLVEQGPNPAFEPVERMAALYGYTKEAAEQASAKVAETLQLLTTRLHDQREAGRRYLIGAELSALDIYWAAFAAMVSPLSQEQCAMPDYLRQSYGTVDETIANALASELIEHRDFIYENHLELPVVIT